MPPVYLDNAATTPLDPRVRETLLHYLDIDFGNPHSRTHDFGLRARRAVEHARDQIAAVLACSRGEVIFTSGATESSNLALLGLADHGLATDRTHIISTQIEHNAVLEPLHALARRGFDITFLPPIPAGHITPESVQAALRPNTLLVSLMHVNNETGAIQPLEEIAEILSNHPAYFHTDAAQSFGKLIQPLRHPRLDLISLSGHKLHAPKGIGALMVRRRPAPSSPHPLIPSSPHPSMVRPPLAPLMYGGGQELNLRPGTLPVPLIAALGHAAELALAENASRTQACLAFRSRLLAALAPLRPTLHGDPARTIPHILNLSFPHLDADTVIDALKDLIAISTGSACTSQSQTCSHVLSSMGLPNDQIEGALRLSWSHTTPDPDYPRLLHILTSLSPNA